MPDVVVVFPFGLLFTLSPSEQPKKRKFQKTEKKKTPGDILQKCTKNHDHNMLYFS